MIVTPVALPLFRAVYLPMRYVVKCFYERESNCHAGYCLSSDGQFILLIFVNFSHEGARTHSLATSFIHSSTHYKER